MATLALALIVKNEIKNIDTLLSSWNGSGVDEIWFVDTGSTDGTLEKIKAYADGEPNPANTKICYALFDWVFDFAKARNYAFSLPKTDYIAWCDGDDSLSDARAFKKWKDEIMPMANYWLNTYNYGFDHNGQVACSFARERVVKRTAGFQWKYFVHEGIAPVGKEPVVSLFASSWTVNHRRTADDLLKDKGRNIGIFEKQTEPLDARMQYYYGKELFENNRPLEAYTQLTTAMKREELDIFDRILCIQYAAVAAARLNQHPQALDLAIRGLQIAPTRAEFFSIMGDAHFSMMKPNEAIPYYKGAKSCPRQSNKTAFGNPIFTYEPAYGLHPTKQLARCYFQMGDLASAQRELSEISPDLVDEELKALRSEIERVTEKVKFPAIGVGKHTEDIVISCPPDGFYEWDEHIYETLGCGGSETAAIEVARNLHKLTGRNVLIYNNRTEQKDFGGVSYRPALKLMDYMGQNIPKVHISWRHTEKVTHAKTYVWCHDLFAQGIEDHSRYDHVLTLSEFHKSFLTNLFGVPQEKIIVTRNGINPKRWEGVDLVSNKKDIVVYTSSPDRGIERALQVMDLVVKEMPNVEFKAYYGFSNMLKMGKKAHVDAIQQMFNERPWATMVGNVDQVKLIQSLAEAKVWLYPTNFSETFCISALEAACSKVYPVVRHFGALPHTLSGLPGALVQRDCLGEDVQYYAERVIDALKTEKWKEMNVAPERFAWEGVATEWVELMGLR